MLASAFRLRVYELIEAAQDEHHAGVREQLADIAAHARSEGILDLAQLATSGVVLYDLYHCEDADQVALGCADLVHSAEVLGLPGLRAVALVLRAQLASTSAEGKGMLADAGLAVALVERDDAPAYERCFVWSTVGCAYAAINLWELADEVFDRAAALAPRCEDPDKQLSAVQYNRVLVRLAWAGALWENDDEQAALDQLERVREAAGIAMVTAGTPALWRREVAAVGELVDFLQRAFTGADVADGRLRRLMQHVDRLRSATAAEVVPYLDPYIALGLLRLDRRDEARGVVVEGFRRSHTTGAESFQAWVRARVLTPESSDDAWQALRDYATVVSRLRWTSRVGVLAAARARIDEARLTAANAVLSREVMRDALTGLENRRQFERWLGEKAHPDRPVALLLMDVDDFKQVNDAHGHGTGDEVLRRIAAVLTRDSREGDVAMRIGGDEFAVIMVASSRLMGRGDADRVLDAAARKRARAVAAAVADTAWDQLSPGLHVTISIGLWTERLGEQHPGAAERAYRLADEDLYATKYARVARLRGLA
jgi:diguanylate cyclase (GGDEF)-like protein